jgi:hypothetical protein
MMREFGYVRVDLVLKILLVGFGFFFLGERE